MQLEGQTEYWEDCTLCPELAASRTQVVLGSGAPGAKLLFVGEGPGEEEDLIGEPFVDQAGQLLRYQLQCAGLLPEEVFFDHTVGCRCRTAADTDRPPTAAEMRRCAGRLEQTIYQLDPVIIVALGSSAFHRLVGSSKKIATVRGGLYHTKITGFVLPSVPYPVVPTYHPKYLLKRLRDMNKGPHSCWSQATRDLRLAIRLHDELRSRYYGVGRPRRQEMALSNSVRDEMEGFNGETDETGE